MQTPPYLSDPYVGVWNTAFPIPGGSIAATFQAFGWFRSVFDTALPEFNNDMAYATSIAQGVLV